MVESSGLVAKKVLAKIEKCLWQPIDMEYKKELPYGRDILVLCILFVVKFFGHRSIWTGILFLWNISRIGLCAYEKVYMQT